MTIRISRSNRLAVVVVLLAGLTLQAYAKESTSPPQATTLFTTIAALDGAVFDAFNHCDDAARLREHAGYFSRDVEFYHDNGGVTWTRHAMIGNTRKFVCGNFRRELVEGSLKVYPIKDFGAVSTGVHRFCQFSTGECEGVADFTIVWQKRGERWRITRVLSYGHRASGEANS